MSDPSGGEDSGSVTKIGTSICLYEKYACGVENVKVHNVFYFLGTQTGGMSFCAEAQKGSVRGMTDRFEALGHCGTKKKKCGNTNEEKDGYQHTN